MEREADGWIDEWNRERERERSKREGMDGWIWRLMDEWIDKYGKIDR